MPAGRSMVPDSCVQSSLDSGFLLHTLGASGMLVAERKLEYSLAAWVGRYEDEEGRGVYERV